MRTSSSILTKIVTITVTFSFFIAVLCGLLFIGFEMKFQPSNIKGVSKQSGSKKEQKSQLFYKTIGKTPANFDKTYRQERKPLGSRYTLEFSTHAKKERAEAMVDSLVAKGVQAYYTPLQRQGRVYFRVRRGVYDSAEAAKQAVADLKRTQNLDARVVKLQ